MSLREREEEEVDDSSQLDKLDLELLIDLVESYPHLYDKTRRGFSDKLKKENSWLSIATTLSTTAKECQRTWTNLRNKYGREKKKMLKKPSGSGCGWEDDGEVWQHYSNMRFLETHIKPRKSATNTNVAKPNTAKLNSSQFTPPVDTLQSDSSSVELRDRPLSPTPSTTSGATSWAPKRIKKSTPAEALVNLSTTASFIRSHLENQPKRTSDDSFGLYVADRLKEMEPDERKRRKRLIIELLESDD